MGTDHEMMHQDMLVYDGECPICQRYVAWTALKTAHPDIQLIDAHTRPDLVATLRRDGIELNDSFLLELDGERHTGAAAMARISTLMPGDSPAAGVLKSITGSERLLTPVYPVLVRLRKLLLAVLGRNQIR